MSEKSGGLPKKFEFFSSHYGKRKISPAAGNNYTQNHNGMLHTANWTVLTPPVINKGAVNFRMTEVGHNNGNTLHLNQNNVSNSGGANNENQVASTVILKEVYYP